MPNPVLDTVSTESPQGHDISVAERAHLIADCVLNYSGVLASGILGVVTVPIMLARLGVDSYGFLVAFIAMGALATCLETGLSTTVTREVASDTNSSDFVAMMATAYLIFGLAASTFAGGLAYLVVPAMHLPETTRSDVVVAILFLSLSLVAERALGFSVAVLAGLRRFGIINAISACSAALRSGGAVVLLLLGGHIRSVAGWYALSSAIIAVAACTIMCRQPNCPRVRFGPLRLASFKVEMKFGIVMTLTGLLQQTIVDARVALVALLCGAGSTVALSVSQKFPFAVSDLNWRAAETLLPAAAQKSGASGSVPRDLLRFGTRFLILMAAPTCTLLFAVSPNLLHLWLGQDLAQAVPIMRLTCVAVFVDSCGLAAVQILWGSGRSWAVLRIYGVSAALGLVLTLVFAPSLGARAAAWALLASSVVANAGFVFVACRSCGDSVMELLKSTFGSALIPTGLLIAIVGVLNSWLEISGGSWVRLLVTLMVSGVVYLLALYVVGARREERAAVRLLLANTLGGWWSWRRSLQALVWKRS
jgi:O-antigen/teichoic acid export membrane protein